MARKSSNEKGNPYHDEATGQFTSAEDSSTQNSGDLNLGAGDGAKHYTLRLKPNFDLNRARNDLQQAKANNQTKSTTAAPIGQYREATSIQDAIVVGKGILPDCLINYSNKCNLAKVNELNKALSDIANRFPGFVQNGLLNAYGDGISLNQEDLEQTFAKSALNVIQKDKYFSRLYDDFFNSVKTRLGFTDEEKYSEQALSWFMKLDENFDMYEYINISNGHGTLAYYQVSQDNIYKPGQGGKGINGAIKFYPSALQKATTKEIAINTFAVKDGYHFDYGEHSYTYGTGVHELGHAIFTIAYKKCNDEERAELNQLLNDGFGKSRNEISRYAQKNAFEQEAEAVADGMCRGENATPHNKKLMAWLDKVHARLKNAGEI